MAQQKKIYGSATCPTSMGRDIFMLHYQKGDTHKAITRYFLTQPKTKKGLVNKPKYFILKREDLVLNSLIEIVVLLLFWVPKLSWAPIYRFFQRQTSLYYGIHLFKTNDKVGYNVNKNNCEHFVWSHIHWQKRKSNYRWETEHTIKIYM